MKLTYIVLASIAMCIALLVLTPDKHTAADVFGQVTDGSGWNSKGFSFLIGFLSVSWTMTDYGMNFPQQARVAANS